MKFTILGYNEYAIGNDNKHLEKKRRNIIKEIRKETIKSQIITKEIRNETAELFTKKWGEIINEEINRRLERMKIREEDEINFIGNRIETTATTHVLVII